jgi:hypothetical protein
MNAVNTVKTYFQNKIYQAKWQVRYNWKRWLVWIIGYPLFICLAFGMLIAGLELYVLFFV